MSAITWYTKLTEIYGPLLVVEAVEEPTFEELVEIELSDGSRKQGRVLEAHQGKAVVQIFGSTAGLDLTNTRVRFLGKTAQMPVTAALLGRTLSGLGEVIDGGPAIIGDEQRDVNGSAINPYAREMPTDFIQTGILTIDGLNTLVRGQKLPIFSLSGLPHNKVAAQIARQAAVVDQSTKAATEAAADGVAGEAAQDAAGQNFAIVFGAMGVTASEAHFFRQEFEKTGALGRSVLFINQADDPVIERILLPRMALTTAEYLAFTLNMHVLVILTDMTNYANALREISAARKEIPGRRGYPGYMYTDLASLYERAGCVTGSTGSVTQIPILTMPDDDKTHPIPDLTGYITEGQIAFSRDLHQKGLYPPVDVLASLSRLKTSDSKTREDHSGVANQLFAAYAKGKEVRELAQILGEASLSDVDKQYLAFAKAFEEKFVRQDESENRTIAQTLDIGWQLLKLLPRTELKRVKPAMIDKYMK